MKRQIFKPYAPQQAMLLPPSVEELIPESHLVRVVSKMIEELDKRVMERQYKGGGTSAYDPQMLLKVNFTRFNGHKVKVISDIESRIQPVTSTPMLNAA